MSLVKWEGEKRVVMGGDGDDEGDGTGAEDTEGDTDTDALDVDVVLSRFSSSEMWRWASSFRAY